MAVPDPTKPSQWRGRASPEPVARPSGNLHALVFVPAAALAVVFVAFAMVFPDRAQAAFQGLQSNVISGLGWYYVALVAAFVVFALWVGFSRFGDIKLGSDDDEPEFSVHSWFALLFAAGMGIGLVFYGVAEPLSHFASPPPGVELTGTDLAQRAITQTYLHWGVHAWSIYVVVGLGVAYAVHRRGRPVSIRWALEPLLGKRVTGRWGDVIDVVALVGTLFGVATSLGLGVLQISSGLDSANLLSPSKWTQTFLIIGIIAITVVSVSTGLERGIKWLSNTNLALAGVLALIVASVSSTLFLLREFVQSIGNYLQNVIGLTFNTLAYTGSEGVAWQSSWTTFYWGWWISWAPLVGIFIARVSRGRTVREFVAGVLLVPTVLGFLWFSIFGGSAIHIQLFGGGGLVQGGTVDTEGALFQMFDQLPAGSVLSFGAILLVTIFFVTSADSGSMVMAMIATGGAAEPKTWIRIFWALSAAAVAIGLLWAGGLVSIQTAAILTAVPFSVVMVAMCLATATAFRAEHRAVLHAQRQQVRKAMSEDVTETVTSRVSDKVETEVAEQLADQSEARR